MARILKGSHSFTCTPRVHLLTEWTIPAISFSAEAEEDEDYHNNATYSKVEQTSNTVNKDGNRT